MSKLLPCPFCGGYNIKVIGETHFSLRMCRAFCYDCQFGGPNFKTPEDAQDWWDTRAVNKKEKTMTEERMLRWFNFGHLPEELQEVSAPFARLAMEIVAVVEPGPERTVALRKLLEAKDAAVRAKVCPGG